MKYNIIFLSLFFPLFINSQQPDYRVALQKAIKQENEEAVDSILTKLSAAGQVPKVPAFNPYNKDGIKWTTNPIYLDTNPTILEKLIQAGTNISPIMCFFLIDPSDQSSNLRCPIEEHPRYQNVVSLLSYGSHIWNGTTFRRCIEKNRDPRIIYTLLKAGAQPLAVDKHYIPLVPFPDPRAKKVIADFFGFIQEKQKENPTNKNYLRYWIGLNIAHKKKPGWQEKLSEIIDLYEETNTNPKKKIKNLITQSRRKKHGASVSRKDLLLSLQDSFEREHTPAFKKFLETYEPVDFVIEEDSD